MKGCKSLGLGLIIFLTGLGGLHGLSAADPSASLSASDSTPDPGDTITLTGSYRDSDGNLSAATIRDLGSGNHSGDLGSFSAIGTAGESISGSSDSISRSFTFSASTSPGTYTFRTEVVDTTSGSDVAWETVTVNDTSTPPPPPPPPPPPANAAPSASLSVNDSTPNQGQRITITGNYRDSNGNLSSATIRNLGSGNKTGNTGSFPSIGTSGESISGTRDSISRNFNIPSSASTGAYTFRTEVVDTNSASDIAWKTVTVNVNPTVSISANDTSISTGGSVTVTATARDSDGSIQSVKFRRNGTTVKTDTSSPYDYTYSSASVGTYRFQAIATDNDGGTKTSNTVTVTVVTPNAAPSASLSVNNSTPNQGQRITITGTYTDSNGNLSSATIRNLGSGNKTGNTGSFPSIGTPGESISGTMASISRNFNIPSSASTGAYTFRTEVVDTNSASDVAWKTVTVNVKPTVSLTVSDTEITEGEMVTLTATATDSDGTVSRVSFIRGKVFQSYNNPTNELVTHTYTPVGTGERTFYAQAFDNDGAVTSSNNVTFTVIAAPPPPMPPTVSISASPPAINEGQSVTVTADAADSDGTIQSVEFRRNGDIEITDTSSPYIYTYSSASAGTHIFEATAEDDDELTTISNTVTVEVNAKPTVSLTVSPAEITLGQEVTLEATAADSDGTVVRVSFIRGKVFDSYNNPTTELVTHSYTPAETGEFTFYAQAFDDDGAVTSSNRVTFTVIAAPPPPMPPTVSISASPPAINEGQSVTVTATAADSDGTIQSVEFRRNGDIEITDMSSPYIYTYSSASAGTHIFEATAEDDDELTTISNTVTVEVNAKPTVSFTVSPAEITLGQEVTLTATADDSDGSVTRVSFIRGKVFVHDTSAPYTHKYTPAETGEFTFYAQALDDDGAFTNSDNVTFTVIAAPPPPPTNEAPEAMLSVSESNPKRGDEIMITGTYTDDDDNLATAAIYDLGTGDSTDDTGTFPIIPPPPPGAPISSITGGEASITRDFTIPVTTALGAYTFRTDVADAASASDAAWETVTVTNNKPAVSLTVLPAEITLGEMVTLTATADDSDGMVTRVSIIRGKVFTSFEEEPYEHEYTPAETGEFTFYAQAFDNDGAVTSSNNVTFTVIAAASVDGVSLSSSAPFIALGREVTLEAEVSGTKAVNRVEFYRDGSLVNTDTASPYSYADAPPAAGIYSYYARAEFSDQSHSDSMPITVVVEEFLTWDHINGDNILDQVLATLRKPPLLGIFGSIISNGVELRIDEVNDEIVNINEQGPARGSTTSIEIVTLTTVGFVIEEDDTYIVQYLDILENINPQAPIILPEWVNWSPILPEPGGSENYYAWCDYENLWRIWSAIPEIFRVIKFGKASYAKGEPYSVDVNGDGAVDRVQEVSPEVHYRGDSEFIIKADCPEGVIGCDEDNTEFVINDNGSWIIVDENQSIARDISPGDPHYPTSDVSSADRVIAVSDFSTLSFFFAEVTPIDSVTINTFIPHNNVALTQFNATLYKGDDRQAGSPPRATWDENGSHRTQQKFKVVAYELIDSNGLVDDAFGPNIDRYVHIGETRSFERATSLDAAGNLTQAALDDKVKGKPMMIDFDRGPNSQVYTEQGYPKFLGFKKVAIKCKSAARLPLITISLAIDYTIMLTIDRFANTYSIVGRHDGFPAYEIYINGTRVYAHDPLVTGEGLLSLGGIGEHVINIVRQPLP